MQKTIRKPVSVEGVGLHTGCEVSLTLRAAPENTGIIFRRTDLQGFEIEAQRKWVSRVVLATTLMKRGVRLSTVEHLLSAVYGCGIDNLYVDIDSLEVPILDGSARPFIDLFEEAEFQDQESERNYLVVEEPFEIEEPGKWIGIEPCDSFSVEYSIDFDHPAIGKQDLFLTVTPQNYAREIAFARTFGFYSEVEELLKKGLIRGGSFDNAVVLGDEGIVNGELRVEDEFVRHKVLDLIGDVSLCGYPLLGKIRAHRAGHALHTRLATELSRRFAAGDGVRRVAESELIGLEEVVNQ